MPLIPALKRQKRADVFQFKVSPDLQSKFQDSQGCTEKHCLEKQINNKKDTKCELMEIKQLFAEREIDQRRNQERNKKFPETK